jgi:2-polyprenyl-3-methyl-5-hydroxy-6-metoxy-1,4-benzoquinol methylase
MNEIRTIAGTVFDEAKFETWNDQMFQVYGNDRLYHHSNPIIRHVQMQRIRLILRWLDLKSSESILDIGCGEGFLFSQLPPTKQRIGLDLSERALSIALSRHPADEWVKGDVELLPFPDGSFDKVCCTEVMEHVLHPSQVLREICRVLKPTGKVVITVPNEPAINRIKDRVFGTAMGRKIFANIPVRTEWHLTEYTPALLHKQIQDLFVVEAQHTLPFWWCALGYGVLCRPVRMR